MLIRQTGLICSASVRVQIQQTRQLVYGRELETHVTVQDQVGTVPRSAVGAAPFELVVAVDVSVAIGIPGRQLPDEPRALIEHCLLAEFLQDLEPALPRLNLGPIDLIFRLGGRRDQRKRDEPAERCDCTSSKRFGFDMASAKRRFQISS
jgi:hypothetical protein